MSLNGRGGTGIQSIENERNPLIFRNQSRLAPDARLVAEDERADWSDRLQEGEDVVPRP